LLIKNENSLHDFQNKAAIVFDGNEIIESLQKKMFGKISV